MTSRVPVHLFGRAHPSIKKYFKKGFEVDEKLLDEYRSLNEETESISLAKRQFEKSLSNFEDI